MLIGDVEFGTECGTYIIAEMSGNHAGSKAHAKEIIHAAKESGADCIKIQTYTPDTLTIDCHNEYFQIADGTWKGENLYQLYGKAYTPWEWQGELKEEAEKIGLHFLSTPFDKTSVDFLESIGLSHYKIASFELVDIPLIEYVASKGKPIIMSTGMATFEEIREAVEAAERMENNKIALLKCASAYPAITDEMNLLTMNDMRIKLNMPVGLSDHSMGSLAAVAAVAMGAQIIEKHFCISRKIKNPDSTFSMEPSEFRKMVDSIRKVELAKGKVKYGPTKQDEGSLKFRKSIFAIKEIQKGEVLTEENIRVIRPGDGLKPKELKNVLGMKAKVKISYGTPIQYSLLEEKI